MVRVARLRPGRLGGTADNLPWLRPVVRDHRQEPAAFRRRQVVAAATLLVGAPTLRHALTRPPGSRSFQLWTIALAAVWAGGAVASGPLHLGRSSDVHESRPLVRPLALGLGAVGLFAAGGALAAQVPVLRTEIDSVIQHARYGDLRLVVPLALITGAAEELFFRGALYAAVPEPHQVAVTTAVYGLATTATKNPMLVLASVLLGAGAGLARRVTGGVQSPVIIHATWTTGMLTVLPAITRSAHG